MSNKSINIESPFHHKLLQIMGGDDMTEIKVNKNYLDAIVNAISGGMVVFQCSRQGVSYLYISPKLFDMLDIKSYDYAHFTSSFDYVTESDRDFFKEQVTKKLFASKDMNINVRFLGKDGTNMWVNINCSVIARKNNSTTYCGVIQKINNYSLVHQIALDEINDMVCVWEKSTESLLYFNKAMQDNLLSSPELVSALIKNEDIYLQENQDNIIFNIGDNNKSYKIKTKDSNLFDRDVTIVFIADVTEKTELESNFEKVIASLACSCIKCKNDSKFTVVAANQMFYDMIEYSKEEFKNDMDNSFTTLILDNSITSGNIYNTKNKFTKKEYPISTKSGKVKYVVDQSVFVEENGEEFLYTTFLDITDRKVSELIAEERFQEEINYKNAMFKTMLVCCRINLDTLVVTDWIASKESSLNINTGTSVSDAFKVLSKKMTKSTIKFLKSEFSADKLRNNFLTDKKNYNVENFIEYTNGKGKWVSIQVTLTTNPEYKNIAAFLYVKDITDDKYLSIAIKKVFSKDYDFIACIDAKNNRSVITNPNDDNSENKFVCADYNKEVERYANTFLLDDDRKEINKLLKLDTVVKELENKPLYEVVHREAVDAGNITHKKYSYSYLNKERGLILFSQIDITALVERENNNIMSILQSNDNGRITDMIAKYTAKQLDLQERLIKYSHTNSLTELPNMPGFEILVKSLMKENPQKDYYIIAQDINGFKVFNEIYGRAKGNEFLVFTASKCSEIIKKAGGVSCHLGADDFVYCCSLDSEEDIKKITDEMSAAINTFPLNYSFVVNAGVYKIEEKSASVTSMCDKAQIALISSKRNTASFALYDDKTRANIIETQEIINEFSSALKNQQFKVYIQPQINISNNKIVGAEALVRWEHPEKGLISPGKFIPVLEENNLITELDRYIISEVFRIMRLLKDKLNETPPAIAVNLSRVDIFNPNLISDLEELSEKYNITPNEVRLEITESVYVSQPKYMIEFVHRLRGKGYSIEMDDFGSGYSSLNVLKDLEIDLLKLDMKFISSINSDKGQKILKSVINMAEDMGIPALVEGVETEEQLNFLKSINCKYVQGYYFGKPMHINNYIELIVKNEYEQITSM